jgi:GWxTD domain-containing protein
MKIKLIYALIILFFLCTSTTSAQSAPESLNVYHTEALTDLNNGKTDQAEKLFYRSAKEYSCAPSYYELAKIELNKNNVYSREKARDYIQKAIWKDPANIEYRLLKAKLLDVFSSSMAYDVYEGILEIDPSNTEALFNMGRIDEDRFYEYHNSIMNYEEASLSYNDYANKFYTEAEKLFRKAIKSDPRRTDSYMHLSYLYSEGGEYKYGIPLLLKVIQLDSLNKSAWLFLGYLYYKTLKFEPCQTAYKKALDLMTAAEREEFKDSTTIILSGDKEVEPEKIDKMVDDFWNSKDPLYLTKYNERLLEHFSRVAYSNIMFSVAKQNLKGWKSDRGEIMVRYGEPLSRVRLRPYMEAGGKTQVMLKTDMWVYKNKTFGFTDDFWTNNFRFSVPDVNGPYYSQYQFDTYNYVSDLRRNDPEEYEPKFNGPLFTLPYMVAQFKNLNNKDDRNTQIYVNYALDISDKNGPGNRFEHRSGLFVIDDESNKIGQDVEEVSYPVDERLLRLNHTEEYWINSLKTEAKPDSVSLAFEIVRKKDGGVSSNHFRFPIKKFEDDKLDISDVILAADVEKQSSDKYPLIREGLGILPNPTQTFTSGVNIFLYYELYNLKQNEDQQAAFSQRIILERVKDSSFLQDLWSVFKGIFGSKYNDEITMTTDYQSSGKNSQVYLQLDMNNYPQGDYIITVTVQDKLAGTEKSAQTLIRWR